MFCLTTSPGPEAKQHIVPRLASDNSLQRVSVPRPVLHFQPTQSQSQSHLTPHLSPIYATHHQNYIFWYQVT